MTGKWAKRLSGAVMAALMAGVGTQSVLAEQTVTSFDTKITGDSAADTPYKEAGVLQDDGTYVFTKDTSISVGNAKGGQAVIGVDRSLTIDASGHTLSLTGERRPADHTGNLLGVVSLGANTSAQKLQLTADTLRIRADADQRAEGIHVYSSSKDPAVTSAMRITGNVDVNARSWGYPKPDGTYTAGNYALGMYVAGNAFLTVDGNVAMKGDDGGWGVDNNYGNAATEGTSYLSISGIYAGPTYFPEEGTYGAHVAVNGDVDLTINGSGIVANGGNSTVDIKGGGTILTNKDHPLEQYAIASVLGQVVMNMNEDRTAAGDHVVNISGNFGVTTASNHPNDPTKDSTITVGLNTKDSRWTGVAVNQFIDEGEEEGYNPTINLYMGNGAVWTNEQFGTTALYFGGSQIGKLSGGSAKETAGYIVQKDENPITIKDYSGFMKVIYAHGGNGTSAEHYAAGDTVIEKAAAASSVTLITNSDGITMDDSGMVASVLNALAGKLVYGGYLDQAGNLLGTVQIADGLTSSSAALVEGKIVFGEGGRGGNTDGGEAAAPSGQTETEFTKAITGRVSDSAYKEAHVLQDDGTYTFTKDSSIYVTEARDGAAINAKGDVTVDASGRTLDMDVELQNGTAYGIRTSTRGKHVGVTAETVNMDVSSMGPAYGVYVQASVGDENRQTVQLHGDVTLAVRGLEAYGLYGYGTESQITIGGDLAEKDENSSWGISGTSASIGLYAGAGSTVSVTGRTDLAADGTGVRADGAGSTVTLDGGASIRTNKNRNKAEYALAADGGTVTVRGGQEKTDIRGNLGALSEDSAIALDLTRSGSLWTGIAENAVGTIQLSLANGSVWNNEAYGQTADGFSGSRISAFKGGSGDAVTGHIFQNDSHALTFGAYSGFAKIYYAHTGDGTAATDYAAGNTVISKADAGSFVTLVTDNEGITMSDTGMVEKALNALAGKLFYSEYADGVKNLSGKVQIADGLTASGKALETGDITFDGVSGQGSYTSPDVPVPPSEQTETNFTQGVTGDASVDAVYTQSGVRKDDGTYQFTKDTVISIKSESDNTIGISNSHEYTVGGGSGYGGLVQLKPGKDLIVNASGQVLTIRGYSINTSPQVPQYLGAGVYQAGPSDAHITAKLLDIDEANNRGGSSGILVENQEPTGTTSMVVDSDLKIHSFSDYNSSGFGNSGNKTNGLWAVGQSKLTVNGNVNMWGSGDTWGIGIDLPKEKLLSSYTNIHGLYASNDRNGHPVGVGGKITVNGNVKIRSEGAGIMTSGQGAEITVNGNADIETLGNDYAAESYSLFSNMGVINLNINKDKTASAGHRVNILGNVGVYGNIGIAETGINLGLSGETSSWTGQAFNSFRPDQEIQGEINLWVEDGARWTNEQYGNRQVVSEELFTGSRVANLSGGKSADTAGVIFQKDTNGIQIDHYSGHMLLLYDHDGNGTEAGNYAAGNTTIASADAGSGIIVSTSSEGITMNDKDMVDKALNALAGKLFYTGYTKGETHLAGKVQIADGLTASSQSKVLEDIVFDRKTGQGTYGLPTPPVSDFTQVITGDAAQDTAYKDVIQPDGSYQFTVDSTVEVSSATLFEEFPGSWTPGTSPTGIAAVQLTEAGRDIVLDAAGHTLTIKSHYPLDTASYAAPRYLSGLYTYGIVNKTDGQAIRITADKVAVITDNSAGKWDGSGDWEEPGSGGSAEDKHSPNPAYGIYMTNEANTKTSSVDIDGDLSVIALGKSTTRGMYAGGRSEIHVSGDVSMKNTDGSWGVSNAGGKANLESSSARDAAAKTVNGMMAENGAAITVDGNVDLAIHGTGLIAFNGGSDITIKGGGTILTYRNDPINESEKQYYHYALAADRGSVSMNMNADGTDAGMKAVNLSGNIGLLFSKYASGNTSTVKLGMATEDSSWTGVLIDQRSEEQIQQGMTAQSDLYIKNGASWTNTQYGSMLGTYEADNYTFTGSHAANLTGGSDMAHAGVIFQQDGNPLTIDRYDGFMKVFYNHEGNGTEASQYAGGSVVIGSAAEGSGIMIATDSSGITMSDEGMVAKVLNALAGKLVYNEALSKADGTLTGTAAIVSGLTSSAQTMESAVIRFDENGQGTTDGGTNPDPEPAADFSTAITGNRDSDMEYVTGGVLKDDGVYVFTKNSQVTIDDGDRIGNTTAGINTQDHAVRIDAEGAELTINTTTANEDWDRRDTAGIFLKNDLNFTADTLAVNVAENTEGFSAAKAYGIKVENGTSAITGNVSIDVTNGTNVYGIYMAEGITKPMRLTIDGDLSIHTTNKDLTKTVAGICLEYVTDGKLTVRGDVDIRSDSLGVVLGGANGANTEVSFAGGTIITPEVPGNSQDLYADAVSAASGTFNMGMNEGKDGANGRDVVIAGNLVTDGGTINAGLGTGDSKLTGQILKKTGNTNLWLANGAVWENTFTGPSLSYLGNDQASHVTRFTGGSSEATAGNIFQKDGNTLTIGSYKGFTNIYYAHTDNGTAAEHYAAAGDTVITSAAEGSGISLITDNSNITMTDKDMVASVLNALAGKLTYTNYAGEKNLAGTVVIAGGLTASSQTLVSGDITFDETTGKGFYTGIKPDPEIPDHQVAAEFTSTLTGDAGKDTEYLEGGIIHDGNYLFTMDTDITINGSDEAAVDVADTVDTFALHADGKTLTLKSEETAVIAGEGHTLDIISGKTIINGKTGIEAAGAVSILGNNEITGADAAIHTTGSGRVTLSGSIVKGDVKGESGAVFMKDSHVSGDITGAADFTLENTDITGAINTTGGKVILHGGFWQNEGDSTVNTIKADKSFVDMSGSQGLKVDNYEGNMTIIYAHDGNGADADNYKGGNTVIGTAETGSQITLSTDNSGIDMKSKTSIESALSALAQKLYYEEAIGNEDRAWRNEGLTGKVQIAGGLTASSQSLSTGDMTFSKNDGKGGYVSGSLTNNPEKPVDPDQSGGDDKPGTAGTITEGDYETYVMKGIRSAATTSLHAWRDNISDLYDASELAGEDGIFAKVLGGKTEANTAGIHEDNTYWGGQVGYDKALKNGWHTGIAFDYRDGDSDYLLGGKGDDKVYSLGVYAKKAFENGSQVKVAVKAGQVENEYTVYNEYRFTKLDGKYKGSAVGITAEYGKQYGSDNGYITPKVQMSWSRVGSDDYTAHTKNDSMDIRQDAYTSLIGRLGFEAGRRNARGGFYAGLSLAHEFDGDINASYYAKDGGAKKTSYEGKDTWVELVLGGRYNLSERAQFYADFARDFGGDFEHQWKLNAGLRFTF